MIKTSDANKSLMQSENKNSQESASEVGKLLRISAVGGPSLSKVTGCSGNPTKPECPLHHVYSLIDPNVDEYDSLDCLVVVYDVQCALEESDDPEFIEKLRAELERCPGCADLLNMESRMREMMRRACGQHAPAELREKLQAMLHNVNIDCENGDDTDN